MYLSINIRLVQKFVFGYPYMFFFSTFVIAFAFSCIELDFIILIYSVFQQKKFSCGKKLLVYQILFKTESFLLLPVFIRQEIVDSF